MTLVVLLGLGCAANTKPTQKAAVAAPAASPAPSAESEGSGRLGTTHKCCAPPPFVDATVVGRLPPEVIKRVVRNAYPKLRACYEDALKKTPGLAGTLSVRFIIDTTGAVEAANLGEGSLTDEGVGKCVLAEVRKLQFDQPEYGKVLVTYPFEFKPEP